MHTLHCSIIRIVPLWQNATMELFWHHPPAPHPHRTDPRPPRGSYLDPGLSELCPQSKLFSDIYVRVMGFLKDLLQLLQLQAGEGGSVSPLLTAGYVAVTLIPKFIQLSLLWHPFHRRHPEAVTVVHSSIQFGVKRLSFHFSDPIVHCTRRGKRQVSGLRSV